MTGFVYLRYVLEHFIRVPLSTEKSFLDNSIQRHLLGTGTRSHTEKLPTASHPRHTCGCHSFSQKPVTASHFILHIRSVPKKLSSIYAVQPDCLLVLSKTLRHLTCKYASKTSCGTHSPANPQHPVQLLPPAAVLAQSYAAL